MIMTGTPGPDLDVLIVGAGLSGIGIAQRLQAELPSKSFVILEGRPASGGTWDLFRFPGIRSDSDMYTLGYEFEPWRGAESIASGEQILGYLRQTASRHGLDDRIRYQQRVISAAWCSAGARWTVQVQDSSTGERTALTTRWLFSATGYFRYDEGHTPPFEGQDRFRGRIVHPQHWPEDLDYRGQRVVVIGSGATAVTIVPAMAEHAGHVTMVQRTPSYVLPTPLRDRTAGRLRRWFGERRGSILARRVNIARQRAIWEFSRRFPAAARRWIRRINAEQLPPGFAVDEHFNPPYGPWDQRLCLAPDADLFRAIGRGDASVVTDAVAGFTESGLQLASGRELAADIVVTATGLNLRLLGGIELRVDGRVVAPADTIVYRGMMLGGVPNLAFALGYPNASWTLKIGLVGEYVSRLLALMDDQGHDTACAVPDPAMGTRPLIDLASGYVRRSAAELPKQGDVGPWRASTGYGQDVRLLRRGPVVDRYLHLSKSARR
jgi:monooxygenase